MPLARSFSLGHHRTDTVSIHSWSHLKTDLPIQWRVISFLPPPLRDYLSNNRLLIPRPVEHPASLPPARPVGRLAVGQAVDLAFCENTVIVSALYQIAALPAGVALAYPK